jgi:hypothetical protein
MWFEHLKEVQENRKKGAKKAAETRKKNRKEKKQDKEQNVRYVFFYCFSIIRHCMVLPSIHFFIE